jgi:hypothetical protein
LVLADEPATICCLPERRTFLRWSAAESEATADAVLAGLYTESEECGTWVSDGSAMLTDFAEADSELDTECRYLGRMPSQTLSCCLPAAGGPGPPISRQVRTTASVWSSSYGHTKIVPLLTNRQGDSLQHGGDTNSGISQRNCQ